MVDAYVLVAHDGDSNRVVVEDGIIVAGSDDVFVGLKLDDIAPTMGNVLKVAGATDGSRLAEDRMRHANVLAKIAGEVGKTSA